MALFAAPPLGGALSNLFAPSATATERSEGSQATLKYADVGVPKSCPAKDLLENFEIDPGGEPTREVPIWRVARGPAFFFVAGMTIDADGAPNAYNSQNTGLDDLANAGSPGEWVGVVQGRDGNPIVQGPDDPFPGYFVSCTSMADRTKSPRDPTRCVDASKIPYIVLPGNLAREAGARLGDLGVAVNLWNGRLSYAIFADVGTLGEGSIALAKNLGIPSDARRGGSRWGVFYLVFPGSGDGQPKSVDEINQQTGKLVDDWGGLEQVGACAAQDAPLRRGEHARWRERNAR